MNKVGKVAYDTTALYGRFRTFISTVFVTLISIILIIQSINMYNEEQIYKDTVVATINSSLCKVNYVKNDRSYDCDLSVSYKKGSGVYQSQITTINSIKYNMGSTINITYNKDNITDIKIPVNKLTKYVFFIIAVFLIILSWSNLYFVIKNKTYASIQGSLGLVNDIFRRNNK